MDIDAPPHILLVCLLSVFHFFLFLCILPGLISINKLYPEKQQPPIDFDISPVLFGQALIRSATPSSAPLLISHTPPLYPYANTANIPTDPPRIAKVGFVGVIDNHLKILCILTMWIYNTIMSLFEYILSFSISSLHNVARFLCESICPWNPGDPKPPPSSHWLSRMEQ